MPRWSGRELDEKRTQALEMFRQAMSEMTDHDDWTTLTDIAWQKMSEVIESAQVSIVVRERFSNKGDAYLGEHLDKLKKYGRYRRTLKAINFLFKCIDVDWKVFLQTVVDLVEGNANGSDSPAAGSKQDGPNAEAGHGDDDSGVGRQ